MTTPFDPEGAERRIFQRQVQRAFDTAGTEARLAYLDALSRYGTQAEADALARAVESAALYRFNRDLPPIYRAMLVRVITGQWGELQHAVGAAINIPSPLEQARLTTGIAERQAGIRLGLLDLDRQTYRNVFETIARMRREGLNPIPIADELARIVPAGRFRDSATRAETIARTEVRHGMNVGAIETAQASGIKYMKIMDNQFPHFEDSVCAAIDGAVIRIENATPLSTSEHPRGSRQFSPRIERVRSNAELIGG